MKTRLALAMLFPLAFLPMPAHAGKKNKEQKMPVVAPAAGSYGLPSARLDPFLEPCLDAILAPLQNDPKLPRVEMEKLRSSFAVGQVKATTQAQQQIFQSAMAVCDALTKAMDERANAKAAAQASSTVPMRSAATGIIKSSPMRGRDAGANAEAIRKKQKDERKDADAEAGRNVTYMNSAAYRSWTARAPALRKSVMVLFTRQVQLEALEEKNAAATSQVSQAAQGLQALQAAKKAQAESAAKVAALEKAAKTAQAEAAAKVAAAERATKKAQTEAADKVAALEKAAKLAQAEAAAQLAAAEKASQVAATEKAAHAEAAAKLAAAENAAKSAPPAQNSVEVAAKPAEKKGPAKADAYVGTWTGKVGRKTITVNEDHTAVRTVGSGEESNGTWLIVDGEFRLHWDEGGGQFNGKLSEDGQRLDSDGGLQWSRKK